MLIRSIRAENFRRYEGVDIEDLPERGLIGIEGPNESGKSTLGELLLFAFFGRARLETHAPVASLIRWGAESMRVEVEFLIRSSSGGEESELAADRSHCGGEPRGAESTGTYLIYREIDRRGSSFVKVLRLPEREEVAVGTIAVRRFVAREIRFDFEEFQRSFYHGQFDKRRWADGSKPSNEIDFLEVATGIAYLRAAIGRAKEMMRTHEERFTQVQTELDRNRAQIERHDRNVRKIPSLTEKSAALEARIAEKESVVCSGREETGELRAEARRLEGRAAAVEAALRGTVTELGDTVRKLLEEDRAACGRRGRVHRQRPWEDALQKPRDILAEVDEFVRGFLDLRERIEERTEEIAELLAPGSEGGASVECEQREIAEVRLRGRVRRLRVFSALFVVLTVAAGGASIAVWQGFPPLEPDPFRTAIGAAGGVTGVFLFLSAWCLAKTGALKRHREDHHSALEAARRQLGRLRTEHQSLLALLEPVAVNDARSALERACRIDDKRVRKRAEEFFERGGRFVGKDEEAGLEAALREVVRLDRDLKGRLFEAAQKSKKKLSGSDAALRKLVSDRDRVASELRECRSQNKKKLALQEKNFTVEVTANAAKSEITTLRQAIGLIEETIVSVRTRVRPAIVDYLKTVLPVLTAGRYRDLKVEENLEIRVFSSEKGDFLAISELSGGTGEALSLSLRLALAQAFVMARVGQAQFVFLDEPFKMMDGVRSIATLGALEELSAELRQVFVAQPGFDATERGLFQYLIRTDANSERLHTVPRSSERPSPEEPVADDRCIEEDQCASKAGSPDLASRLPDGALGSAATSFKDDGHASATTTRALTPEPPPETSRDSHSG